MAFPFVLIAGVRLSHAELTAACLDGDLVAIGDAFAPADVVESPALRAASLAALVGDTLAVTHLSAAWVHGVLDIPPHRHTLQRAVDRRLHHMIDRRFVYRDSLVDPVDLATLGGVPVTTSARTLADLARMPDPAHEATVRAWGAKRPDAVDDAIAWLSCHTRLPHRRRARELLASVRTT